MHAEREQPDGHGADDHARTVSRHLRQDPGEKPGPAEQQRDDCLPSEDATHDDHGGHQGQHRQEPFHGRTSGVSSAFSSSVVNGLMSPLVKSTSRPTLSSSGSLASTAGAWLADRPAT